ncbi:hypothetical protein LTR74_001899 [Friedmanniomyces endolithicus]|nr:hypothetical protein LTR74_001899 [Friedmanniomyces endolithicus]
MPTNQAAWFHANGGAFTVGEAPMPQLAGDEILIRSHAIAFNPADVAVWKSGLFTTSLPATVGCDVAGVIAAVGHSASKFQVGDRVLAVPNWSAEDRVNKGSGQLYCAAFEGLTAKLPEAVGFTDGCVLPLALCTAASSLFQKENLGLPLPGLDVNASKSEAKVLLVWGGSSSVGSCAIQMARAAGLIVATTCGARNFEYCSSQVPTGLPEEVQISFCWSTHIKDDEVGPPLFEWITKALAKGVLRCKPGSEVVGRGLEAVQQAVERMEKGVSATKLVVEIP